MRPTALHSTRAWLIAGAIFAVATSGAHATPLLPNTTAVPGILSSSAGTIVSNGGVPTTLTFPLSSSNPLFSGILRAAVFNPGLPGGPLDFYYQVSNDSTSLTSLHRMSNFSFDEYETSVFYRTDAVPGFATPTSVSSASPPVPLSADRDNAGLVVGFDYALPGSGNTDGTQINPGETSFVVVIRTNATGFTPGGTSLIDGGSATLATFAPLGLVPEPASLILLGSAFGLSGFIARRRRARQQRQA